MTTTDTLDADVAALKAAIDAVVRARIRAEQQRDHAHAQAESARTALRDEFGVDTVDDGMRLLADLDTELTHVVATVRDHLKQAGAA